MIRLNLFMIWFLHFLSLLSVVCRCYRQNLSSRIIVVLVYTVSTLFFYHERIFEQISERLIRVSLLDDGGREDFYNNAIKLLAQSDYMGIGPFGFKATAGYDPHNLWLEILSQYGLLVFSQACQTPISRLPRELNASRHVGFHPQMTYSLGV